MNCEFKFEGYDVSVCDNINNGLYDYEVSFAGIIRGEFKTVRVHLTDYVYDTESKVREVQHTTDMTLWLAHKLGGENPHSFLEKLIPFMKDIMVKPEHESKVAKLNRVLLELESMEIVLALPDYHFKYGWDEFTWNGHYEVSNDYCDYNTLLACTGLGFTDYPDYYEVYDEVSSGRVKAPAMVGVVTPTGSVVNIPVHTFRLCYFLQYAKPVNGVSKVRRESLYDLSGRVFNIKGNLCKAPLMPSLDKVYDKSYYGQFEVKSRFCNWDGSVFSPLF